MNKNVVIMLLLAITSVVSVAFAFYQKEEAQRNESRLEEQLIQLIDCEKKAEQMMHEAHEQMRLAEQQRNLAEMEAIRQKQIAEEESKKKKSVTR